MIQSSHIDPFSWLNDRAHLRASLRSVASALRNGRLDDATAEHRLALTKALKTLQAAPDLTSREAERLGEVLDLLKDEAPPVKE